MKILDFMKECKEKGAVPVFSIKRRYRQKSVLTIELPNYLFDKNIDVYYVRFEPYRYFFGYDEPFGLDVLYGVCEVRL